MPTYAHEYPTYHPVHLACGWKSSAGNGGAATISRTCQKDGIGFMTSGRKAPTTTDKIIDRPRTTLRQDQAVTTPSRTHPTSHAPRGSYPCASITRHPCEHRSRPGERSEDQATRQTINQSSLPHRRGDVVERVRRVKRSVLVVSDHRRRQVVKTAHIRHLRAPNTSPSADSSSDHIWFKDEGNTPREFPLNRLLFLDPLDCGKGFVGDIRLRKVTSHYTR